MTSDQETNQIPPRALIVLAHPDDAEFICAGTVARWTAGGSHVVYAVGTSGDKGSSDPDVSPEWLIETREQEQRDAARVLGVKEVEFLRMRDAEVVADLNLRLNLTRLIRKHKPDAVVCQDPTNRWSGQRYIQHPDHIAMGEATLAAVFPSARDRLTFPELLAEGLEPHKASEVYLFGAREPDVWIDITSHFDTKVEAIKAHRSQVGDWSGDEFLRRWGTDTAAQARSQGFPGAFDMELAEAFKYFRLG